MTPYAEDQKTALKRVRNILHKPIVIEYAQDITHQIRFKRDILFFSIIGMKFMRELSVIFLGLDVALRYNSEGLSRINELITLSIACFGIYGLMTYGIRTGEKRLDKLESQQHLNN